MLQEELLRQGTRVPYGLEETTSSPELVSSLRPRVLGILSCLQSNLRTEGCLVCQRQFPCLSGNKPTDLKPKFHKKYTSEKELSAGSLHFTNPAVRDNHNE